MRNEEIIRAWKDERYRLSLGEAERRSLPEHPAGAALLSDSEMSEAGGRFVTWDLFCGPLLPTSPAFCFPSMLCDTSDGCPPR